MRIFDTVICLILGLMMVGLIGVVIVVWNEQNGEFEYTTAIGESGVANFCTVSYGQARCRTNDGTTIMVERYTKK